MHYGYIKHHMQKILISACILGHRVRYDAKDNLTQNPRLQKWIDANRVIKICPEMAGGLPTPRAPAEIQKQSTARDVLNGKGKILTNCQQDVSAEYITGAKRALALVQAHNIKVAILKARSPSCGTQKVYDGSFTGTLIDGNGVTAELLLQHNIKVFNEMQIDEALDCAESILQ